MKGRRRLIATVFGLAILAGLVGVRFWDPAFLRSVRELGFDTYQQLAPRQGGQYPIRIIDIDERSLAAVGQWPWPRDELTELNRRLTELGAAAIAYDFLFSEPDRASPRRIAESVASRASGALTPDDILRLPDFDADFAAALAASPSVLAFSVSAAAPTVPDAPKVGVAISGSDPTAAVLRMPGASMPLPQLAEAARGLGAINLNPEDSVDVVRRIPLVFSNGKTLFPALSMEALRVALQRGVQVVDGEQAADGGGGYMSGLEFGPNPVDPSRNLTVPTTKDGLFLLYFSHYDPSQTIPAWAVLGDDYKSLAPGIGGHIVFVGTSAEGLLDIKATPLGEDVPGVFAHAQIVEQALAGKFLYRYDAVVAAEYLAFLVVGLAIIFFILRSGPMVSLALGAAFGTFWLGSAWWAFRTQGILVDTTFPLGGGFIVYAAMIFLQFTITDADKRMIRRAFGHYVAPAVLSQIEKSNTLTLGGEERDLSIMFIDVRNFTSISEGMEPRALVAMLNAMFEALGAEITASFGTIDKFIGDAIMAFWNAPMEVERHPLKACQAALKARAALARINDRDGFGLKARGGVVQELRIGIGIATGEALVGNMGLQTRFDYSCVGDVVNVASRVEGACKVLAYDIAVVDATRRGAAELAFLEAGALALKGKAGREPIHILVGDEALAQSAAFKALEKTHQRLLASLAGGSVDAGALDRCVAVAGNIDDQLLRFYEAITGRIEDFREYAGDAGAVAPAPAK